MVYVAVLLLVWLFCIAAFIGIMYTYVKFLIAPYITKAMTETAQFDCSVDAVLPLCDLMLNTNINLPYTPGYLTTKNVLPQSMMLPPVSSRFPLLYYHGHPSALYDSTQASTLYTFPYVITTTYPIGSNPYIRFAAYERSLTPIMTNDHGFNQYSFPTIVPDSTNSWMIDFTTASQNFILGTSIDNNSTPPYRPNLTTILQSSTDFSLITAQGVPYITLTHGNSVDETFVFSGTYNQTVALTGYNCVILSDHGKFLAIFYSVNNVITVNTATPVTFMFHSTHPILTPRQYFYITSLNDIPPTAILQSFADNLNLPFVYVADIYNTQNKVAIQYTCATITMGSLMWVPPSTVRSTDSIEEMNNFNDHLELPVGHKLYLTYPITTMFQPVSFYTYWNRVPIPTDFNYNLPSASQVNNLSYQLTNLNELYQLTMTMRIMLANGINIPYDMSFNATTYWKNNMLMIQYDPMVKSLRVEQLGNELGLITYFSYLLLSYINLFIISQSGVWPSSSVPFQIVRDEFYHNLVLAIIDAGFTTQLPSPSLYFPLQFIDFYTCTMPNVNYNDPIRNQYRSRYGETLGYIWASYQIRNLQASNVNQGSSDLLESIYSIMVHSNPYLLAGNCMTPTNIYPILPWNGYSTTQQYGFKLDNSWLGNSPDAVFIQSLLPFSPASNQIIAPLLRDYLLSVMKILKCNQQSTAFNYYFGGYVDPNWVGYFLYLFDGVDRTTTFTEGVLDADELVFINQVGQQFLLVDLMMNKIKLL